jgi:hypothetical protein
LGLSLEPPQAACASSARALAGAVATRTVHGPRRQAREGVGQMISIRLKRLHVDMSEFPKGISLSVGADKICRDNENAIPGRFEQPQLDEAHQDDPAPVAKIMFQRLSLAARGE